MLARSLFKASSLRGIPLHYSQKHRVLNLQPQQALNEIYNLQAQQIVEKEIGSGERKNNNNIAYPFINSSEVCEDSFTKWL